MTIEDKALFRINAIKGQSSRLDGEVLIARPVSSYVLFSSLVIIILVAIVFLVNAQFHRKEAVMGYLSPSEGTSKILAPSSGVVSQLLVNNGEFVQAGEPLALVTTAQQTSDGLSVNEALVNATREQLDLMTNRMSHAEIAFEQERDVLQEAMKHSDRTRAYTATQIQLANERLVIQQARLDRLAGLQLQGAVTQNDVDTQSEQVIVLNQQIAELKVIEQQASNQLAELEARLASLPIEHQQSIALLESEKSRLSQQLLSHQASGEWLITAPTTGKVTNIGLSVGDSVRQQQYVMTVLPESDSLCAILLVPSRAYGFVTEGQNTKIRFDAFPYQRFGLFDGEVIKTSDYIVMPGEIDMPVAINKPVYKVEVAMASQSISAYGQSVPLQPGMTISADIVLEERSLLSWLFEPIISLKGRV
ncbi:HlyD family efflux transporter periplasmic adaptor subunit [Alteromonas sp. LMIT006]|jgi:membrane fusion protein|uniref:HlyD family secretion protein n=1 Tax=Alteromonadaceae TaxID=72275 RepID=UPI0020CA75B8|nr:HlyD family efflux transporter periplasmic adaptor subunit [Alteromonas sp. LMIT006]UTP71641.1 HlyD family efflux transporter periplasmic adaptor subunit [Alteromonas sp. LMIT006]